MRRMRMASASFRGKMKGHKELEELIAAESNMKQAWKEYIKCAEKVSECQRSFAETVVASQPRKRLQNLSQISDIATTRCKQLSSAMKDKREFYRILLSKERVVDTFNKDRAKQDKQLLQMQSKLSNRGSHRNNSDLQQAIQSIKNEIDVTKIQMQAIRDEINSVIDNQLQLVYSEFLREQRMIFNTMAVANSLMELYLRTDDETHVLQAQVALTQGDTSEEGQQLRRRASMSLSSSTQDQPPQYSLTPNPV
eukprot:m.44441 g.44441  ORF g.44441 m.44441 type:complete len:252 (+) comp10608_c0_seq5:47-802(+)